MTDDLGVLPITPGSDIDLALISIVANIVDKMPFKMDAFRLVDLHRPDHMLALGTRVWCYKGGQRNPSALVSSLFLQWYGQVWDGDTARLALLDSGWRVRRRDDEPNST